MRKQSQELVDRLAEFSVRTGERTSRTLSRGRGLLHRKRRESKAGTSSEERAEPIDIDKELTEQHRQSKQARDVVLQETRSILRGALLMLVMTGIVIFFGAVGIRMVVNPGQVPDNLDTLALSDLRSLRTDADLRDLLLLCVPVFIPAFLSVLLQRGGKENSLDSARKEAQLEVVDRLLFVALWVTTGLSLLLILPPQASDNSTGGGAYLLEIVVALLIAATCVILAQLYTPSATMARSGESSARIRHAVAVGNRERFTTQLEDVWADRPHLMRLAQASMLLSSLSVFLPLFAVSAAPGVLAHLLVAPRSISGVILYALMFGLMWGFVGVVSLLVRSMIWTRKLIPSTWIDLLPMVIALALLFLIALIVYLAFVQAGSNASWFWLASAGLTALGTVVLNRGGLTSVLELRLIERELRFATTGLASFQDRDDSQISTHGSFE